jgi:2-methylcitrate dehydratase PrpD
LKLDFQKTLWAFGSAGTQSAGLWQFLSDATHSKQLHTSKANFNGLLSAYAAKEGLTGTSDILGGKRGMAAYMCDDTYPDALAQNLGKRWTVLETSFKWHASCRHTHPSVDGLLELMTKHNIQFEDIERVQCGVYQAAIDVLGDGVETVHQSKFSMGFVIAVAAKYGRAGITDFTEAKLKEKDLLEFMTRVEMILDDEINAAFPKEWMAVVCVTTKDGRKYETKMETPKGDPGNTLTKYGSIVGLSELMCREEIDSKARGLFRYGGWTDAKAQDELINKLWEIEKEMKVTL